ncbi:MAG TPA: hypothetical protein VF574_17270 [Allosphingosinicella sp.]|jgi:hypothetical protein
MPGAAPILAGAAAMLAALSAPAAAQIVPGTRAPETTAELVGDAQMVVCFLAAAGRPMPGLNMPLLGEEGMTVLTQVPDPLARLVENRADQAILELKSPADPVWIVHDRSTRRCAIYALTDPAPVEAKLMPILLGGSHPWRRVEAGAGVDQAFALKLGRERFLTEISRPRAAGEPLLVVVRPGR